MNRILANFATRSSNRRFGQAVMHLVTDMIAFGINSEKLERKSGFQTTLLERLSSVDPRERMVIDALKFIFVQANLESKRFNSFYLPWMQAERVLRKYCQLIKQHGIDERNEDEDVLSFVAKAVIKWPCQEANVCFPVLVNELLSTN
ncbi:hypothetical protein ACOME3_009189 [Neoechinorhynchus agilis]